MATQPSSLARKNAQQYARLDICLECSEYMLHALYYSDKLARPCSEQFIALKHLFRRIGITKYLEK